LTLNKLGYEQWLNRSETIAFSLLAHISGLMINQIKKFYL